MHRASVQRRGLLWLLFPAAGLLELGLTYYFAHRAPRLAEWASIREPVRKLKQSDELVLIAPRWAEPLGRQALGDEMMPLKDIARPDEAGYARAIEVSIMGQHAPEAAGWRAVSEERQGQF